MFSEKQFREWQERLPAVRERERERIRAEVAAEIDASLEQIQREREAEKGRAAWAKALGRSTVVSTLAEQERANAASAEAAVLRRAEIRAGVERDVAAWERQSR